MVEVSTLYKFTYVTFEQVKQLSAHYALIINNITLCSTSPRHRDIGKARYFHGFLAQLTDGQILFVNQKPQNIDNLEGGDILVSPADITLVRRQSGSARAEVYLRGNLVPFYVQFAACADLESFAEAVREFGVRVE